MLADGKIYITDEDGVTSVVQAGPTFAMLAENDLGEYTLSSPAISEGQIFIRTDAFLYAIGQSGNESAGVQRCQGRILAVVASVGLIASGYQSAAPVAGQAAEPAVRMIADEGEAARYWTRWRGPSGQGLVDGKGYPDTWSATENVVWKVPVPGSGNSSPIVWRDRIFLTTATDDGSRRRSSPIGAPTDSASGRPSCRRGRPIGRTARTATPRRRWRPTASASTRRSAAAG